jgi:hypothetical protein
MVMWMFKQIRSRSNLAVVRLAKRNTTQALPALKPSS